MFRVAKVDADKQRSLVEVLGVAAFPSIFGLENGIIIDNFVGILPQDEVRVTGDFFQGNCDWIAVWVTVGLSTICAWLRLGYCRVATGSAGLPRGYRKVNAGLPYCHGWVTAGLPLVYRRRTRIAWKLPLGYRRFTTTLPQGRRTRRRVAVDTLEVCGCL